MYLSTDRMRLSALAMLLALMLVGLTTGTARGYWVGDEDIDGVIDGVDQCPGTPILDVIYQTSDIQHAPGCSVCPCTAAWASHDAYVSCVNIEANRRVLNGTMSTDQRTAVMQHAQNSTCGNPTVTRCCAWKSIKTGTGACSIVPAGQCTAQFVKARVMQDRGSGSCYYNPCNW